MDGGGVITAVLIDDHPAIVAGVSAWCATADPPVRIVAAGARLVDAWVEPGRSADVVIFDLQLRGNVPAYTELRQLVEAGRRVIVYSMREDDRTALTCLDLGAVTYLTKAEGQGHLVEAARAAAADRPYTPPALAGAMRMDLRSDRPRLAPREIDVLTEWFRSESKDLVAVKLHLSPRTVSTYLDRVRIKYAAIGRPAPTKAALVARAVQDGLINIDEL